MSINMKSITHISDNEVIHKHSHIIHCCIWCWFKTNYRLFVSNGNVNNLMYCLKSRHNKSTWDRPTSRFLNLLCYEPQTITHKKLVIKCYRFSIPRVAPQIYVSGCLLDTSQSPPLNIYTTVIAYPPSKLFLNVTSF